MLIIRAGQIKKLNALAEAELVARLAGRVRELHGELVAGLDDAALGALVRVGVARARRHGLSCEETIGTFVGWMFECAPNFDEQEHIARMLADARVEPDDRIELVAEAATEADWQAAAALYDEAAWDADAGAPAEKEGSKAR